MIVGTAGHIDHGKSALVRALTGIESDRLPEERKRGISIELGYAFLDVPGAASPLRIGFIDVPGHERLVHTMLAGASGIDFALLLIAADDGVMPQTREHLAVLSLLGISRGAVVITKCDLVDAARADEVRAEARVLLAGTPLAEAPVLSVSAVTGEGVDALKQLLFEAARHADQAPAQDAAFRLSVDRVFVLDGIGVVVTGTARAGVVAIDDELELVPAHRVRRGRVRSLQVHGARVERAMAGQRCAIGLAGLAKDEIERGLWLVAPDVAQTTQRIDTRLTVWREEAAALRSGASVHVHIGAGHTMGTVAILDADGGNALAPGASGYVQVVLREAVGAWHGDRVVLRDASASRTIAGGTVLDPQGPARYRRTSQRLSELAAHEQSTPQARLAARLAAAPYGMDLSHWARGEGLPASAIPPLPADTLHARDASVEWVLGAAHARTLRNVAIEALRGYHAREPDEVGPEVVRLRRLAVPRLPTSLWRALLAQIYADGAMVAHGAYVHLPDHGIRLSLIEERIAQKLAPLLAQAGAQGAWVRDLARLINESEPLMRTTLARLARRGEVHQVVRDLYYSCDEIAGCAGIVRELAQQGEGSVKVADFRDRTALGRKRAIQILEYFDRIGLLRRVGEVHKLRADSDLFRERAHA